MFHGQKKLFFIQNVWFELIRSPQSIFICSSSYNFKKVGHGVRVKMEHNFIEFAPNFYSHLTTPSGTGSQKVSCDKRMKRERGGGGYYMKVCMKCFKKNLPSFL